MGALCSSSDSAGTSEHNQAFDQHGMLGGEAEATYSGAELRALCTNSDNMGTSEYMQVFDQFEDAEALWQFGPDDSPHVSLRPDSENCFFRQRPIHDIQMLSAAPRHIKQRTRQEPAILCTGLNSQIGACGTLLAIPGGPVVAGHTQEEQSSECSELRAALNSQAEFRNVRNEIRCAENRASPEESEAQTREMQELILQEQNAMLTNELNQMHLALMLAQSQEAEAWKEATAEAICNAEMKQEMRCIRLYENEAAAEAKVAQGVVKQTAESLPETRSRVPAPEFSSEFVPSESEEDLPPDTSEGRAPRRRAPVSCKLQFGQNIITGRHVLIGGN